MDNLTTNTNSETENLKLENRRLKQPIRLLEKALFGPKSERMIDLDENQLEFDQFLEEFERLNNKLEAQEEEQVRVEKKL